MPKRLREEEVVTIRVLAEKGQSHCEVARTIGVNESTVRYHLRRSAEGTERGRREKPPKAQTLAEMFEARHAVRRDSARPAYGMELYEHLIAEYDNSGSFQTVRCFVRRHYSKPRMRTDWRFGEFPVPRVRPIGRRTRGWISASVLSR